MIARPSFGQCVDRVAIACSSAQFHQGYAAGVPEAFPFSTGLAQKASCRSERREIMTRRESLDEVPELLTHGLIGKSTGEGVERPKFQPAAPCALAISTARREAARLRLLRRDEPSSPSTRHSSASR